MSRPDQANAVNASTLAETEMLPLPRFSRAERDRRWSLVRQLMVRDGVDVIVAPPNTSDARYLSQCGDGPVVNVGLVFPLEDEPTLLATSAVRWGPRVQNWIRDVRDVDRHYGRAIAERLAELRADGKRIGVCGLASGTRTPEGSIFHGTQKAITEVIPNSEIVDATPLLQEARRVKSDEEIGVLQQSVDVAEKAYETEIEWAARPGIRDDEVWGATIGAMLIAGSELIEHFNWVAANPPGRTMTIPQHRVLIDGDIIVNEVAPSIRGYRAQQVRPVAVRSCDQIYFDLMAFHQELFARLLESIRPGTSVREITELTRVLGKQLCPKAGPLAGGGAHLIASGRGLGDDEPLVTTERSIEQFADWQFPANGIYVFKPTVSGGNRARVQWGDTCRITEQGAVRMGKAPHEMVVAT